MPPRYAQVAILSQTVPDLLSYAVPAAMADRVTAGSLVLVPLQTRLVSGVVWRVGEGSAPNIPLKPIHRLLDEQPVLNHHQLALAGWIAEEYYAPLGRCCALMVPPGLTPKSAYVFRLSEAGMRAAYPDDDPRARVLGVLRAHGPLVMSKLARRMRGVAEWRRALKALLAAGLVARAPTVELPRVQPQRATLVQLAVSEEALSARIEGLLNDRGLRAPTRARRAAVLRYLRAHRGLARAEWVMAETGATRADLSWLAGRGYIILGDVERWRDPLADVDYVPKAAPPLTADQQRVWEAIAGSLCSAEHPGQFLLRGVTGSGKTEIYLRAAEAALAQGRGAIILVPEISLTPQTARRFLERFPGQVALIHSRLKPGERYDTWRRIRAGALPIVVGARSALFAPLPNPGLIVLDEEHDPSYKQTVAPCYDARRVALRYSELTGATLIFGSATPSLEAWQMAMPAADGPPPRLKYLELPNRVRAHIRRLSDQEARLGVRAAAQPEAEAVAYQPLPEVHVVDMRAELRAGNIGIFSQALAQALGETLRRGEQAILFLNRRGAASSVVCRDCGHVLRCPDDDTPLTYHAPAQAAIRPHLKCHQCNRSVPLPDRCPACGSPRIRFFGIGTQKVEQAILERFPGARVVRWDRDAAGSSAQLLQRFVKQQADVLVGTQMIAKGLDLPLVTLVGVVLADVGLFLPDFRAAERVFNLLLQVAGRAGRSLLPGRVIVQTYNPEHPAVTFAARHDVEGFVRAEMAQRRLIHLPPFVRLVRFEYADADSQAAQRACEALAVAIRRSAHQVGVIGPAAAYFARRQRRYRWQVLVRTHDPRALLADLKVPEGFLVDVDPVSVL
jgi:primosomal protein N' (replication factor Y)